MEQVRNTLNNCSSVHLYSAFFFTSSIFLHETDSFCFVRRIQEVEIGEALKRMKRGKAMGPDGIPIEVWRCLGDRAIVWLTKLFNLIFSVKQDAGRMEEKYISPYLQKQGRCSKLY